MERLRVYAAGLRLDVSGRLAAPPGLHLHRIPSDQLERFARNHIDDLCKEHEHVIVWHAAAEAPGRVTAFRPRVDLSFG